MKIYYQKINLSGEKNNALWYMIEAYSAHEYYNDGDEIERIELPATTIELQEISTKRSVKARIGLPSESYMQIKVRLTDLLENDKFQDFINMIYKPTLRYNGTGMYDYMNRPYDLGTVWRFDKIYDLNKKQLNSSAFIGIQTIGFEENIENNASIITITAEHIVLRALKSIDCRAVFAEFIYKCYKRYATGSYGTDIPECRDFPFGYDILIDNRNGNIADPSIQLFGVANGNVMGWDEKDKNGLILFSQNSDIDYMLWTRVEYLEQYLAKAFNYAINRLKRNYFLPGEGVNISISLINTIYYQQTYNNTGNIGDPIADLWFNTIKSSTFRYSDSIVYTSNEDKIKDLLSCGEMYDKLNYESLYDYLQDMRSSCCMYSPLTNTEIFRYPIYGYREIINYTDANVRGQIETINVDSFKTVVSSNADFSDNDVQKHTQQSKNAGQGGNSFNANNTFGNQTTVNTDLDWQGYILYHNIVNMYKADGNSQNKTEYGAAGFDVGAARVDIFDENKYGGEMVFQLYYMETKTNSSLPIQGIIPIAVHSFCTYDKTNGYKESDAGKFKYPILNMRYSRLAKNKTLKEVKNNNDWRLMIADSIKNMQEKSCHHIHNSYAIVNTVTNNNGYEYVVIKATIPNEYIDIHYYEVYLRDAYILNSKEFFNLNMGIDNMWYPIGATYNAITGMLELELVNKTY